MTWAKVAYCGDVVWEKDGKVCSTCCGDICIEGAGCTHSYNHRHRGKQTAFVVSSRTTGKSLVLVVSNVSSHVCFASTLSINHVHSHFCPNYRPLVLDAFVLSAYKLKLLAGMYPQRKLQICPWRTMSYAIKIAISSLLLLKSLKVSLLPNYCYWMSKTSTLVMTLPYLD